ncbi:hypothetical protein VH22019_00046 [Vibrio phage VH2_2019]|nr:hypothetical protein VH22019_00046 [Vibrio phage VH2_2019]
MDMGEEGVCTVMEVLQLTAPALVIIPLAALVGTLGVWLLRTFVRSVFSLWLDLRLLELNQVVLRTGTMSYYSYHARRVDLQNGLSKHGTVNTWKDYKQLKDQVWGKA